MQYNNAKKSSVKPYSRNVQFVHCVSKKMCKLRNGIAQIITIDFDDIWQKHSKYSQIEFACFSFRVGLFFHQFFVFQTGHQKQHKFWRCIKQTCQLWRGAFFFLKHTPKLIIFGIHNLQTFIHNTLINELLPMQFYLFNICPKLHRRKWRKLRVITQFRTFSTSPTACWCCCSSNLYLETLL